MKGTLEIALAVCALVWLGSLAIWTDARHKRDNAQVILTHAAPSAAPKLVEEYQRSRRTARASGILLVVTGALSVLLAIGAAAGS